MIIIELNSIKIHKKYEIKLIIIKLLNAKLKSNHIYNFG